MNFGYVIRHSLARAELPIDSWEMLDLARGYANENIQQIFDKVSADYKRADSSISVVAATDTYALDKYFQDLIKDTLRGPSTNPRTLKYKNPQTFARMTCHGQADTGTPRIFTFYALRKYETQLSAASTLKIKSGLANVTTGTCAFTSGSRIVTSSSSVFTHDHIGLRIKKDGDSKAYRIARFISTAKVELEEKYRGATASTASYTLGDIGVYVTVTGIVSGQEDSETEELNGTSEQTTTKSFTSIISVAKSDYTGGAVTIKNSAGTTTVATLAPAEFDIDVRVIKIWPIPTASETLSYSYYKKHPLLRLPAETLLIPNEWHRLALNLTIENLCEWTDRTVPNSVIRKIEEDFRKLEDDAEDTRLETIVPADEGGVSLGDEYYYDHDEDF